MPRLSVCLLGPPSIELDGAPIHVDTRKAIALLAYLAVTRRSHSRDALASLLWYDYKQSNARAALRRTLSSLKSALHGEWLDIGRETVGLRDERELSIDIDRFHIYLAQSRAHLHDSDDICNSCLQALTEAVKLYRDDFLAGFALHDSPSFDDWQLFQTEELRREFAGALERLVRGYDALAQFEIAIPYARRWLALDPLHEPAHQQLMQLYNSAGQRSTALRQYRDCVRVLEEELAVPPLEETTSLYQTIKENRQPVAAVREKRTEESKTQPELLGEHPGEYPLVGRAQEWTTLVDAYRSIGPNGHVLVLEGEAGIGKTRLANEFLRYVGTQGAATLAARCYEGESNLAYIPFIVLLRDAIAQVDRTGSWASTSAHHLSEVTRLLPHLNALHPGLPEAPPLDNPGAQSRFFDGVGQTLVAVLQRSQAPGVLFIDDLQWADTSSLDLLAYLTRRLTGSPICILVTWRAEQTQLGQRLGRYAADARRTGAATVLQLTRLSRAGVLDLVRAIPAVQGERIAGSGLGSRLYEETEGLPLFLSEYLSAIQKSASLGEAGWPTPSGVKDLLRSRLERIGESGWQLLSVGAVIGRSFDFDTVRVASGRNEDMAVAALEELIARGLVTETRVEDGVVTYDFTHEKLRALVYEETSLTRRRLLHRRVAEALVHRAHDPRYGGALAGTIARHYRMAGQDREASEFLVQAGKYARSLYANREALAHYGAALALGHPDTRGLHEAIGDLRTVVGEYSAAIREYEMAAALCDGPALATIEHWLGNVHARRGAWGLAASSYESALNAMGQAGHPAEQAKLYADWSLVAHRSGELERAVSLAGSALALAKEAGDTFALAQAHNALGILAKSQGDRAEARRHLESSLSLADRLGDPAARAAALNNLALAYGAEGEIERACQLAESALVLCVEIGDRHREAALHNNLADLLYAGGATEAAIDQVKQAVAIYAEIGVEAGAVQPEIWKLVEW